MKKETLEEKVLANEKTPEDIFLGYLNEVKEKIYIDLLKIADDGEFEDMRREITRYFEK